MEFVRPIVTPARRVGRSLLVIFILAAAQTSEAQDGRGAIELRVIAAGTSLPVSYADVSIASENFSAFTDSAGTLVIRLLPPRTLQLRVRRVGFRPTTTRVTVTAGTVQQLRVPLEMIAMRLASIRVGADVCPGGGDTDTAVVAIMQQARLNGERYAMLAERYPFSMMMERVFGEQGKGTIHWSGRAKAKRGDRVVQHLDTVETAGRSEWRYAPGKLIQRANEQLHDGTFITEKMMIPHLADLADTAFVTTHCFRFAGVTDTDSGGRAFRVDFRPAREIRTRDVRGSMYLDTASFQILKTTLFASRPAPAAPVTDMWLVRVDTWFREVFSGIPVIDRIESTTMLETTRHGALVQPFVATEDHHRLDLRFLRGHPGDGGVVTEPEDARGETMPVSCAWRGAELADSATIVAAGIVARLCYATLADPMILSLSRELEVAGVVVPGGQNTVRLRQIGNRWLAVFYRGVGTDAVEIGRGEPVVETLDAPVSKLVVREGREGADPAFVIEWNALRARIPLWSR